MRVELEWGRPQLDRKHPSRPFWNVVNGRAAFEKKIEVTKFLVEDEEKDRDPFFPVS